MSDDSAKGQSFIARLDARWKQRVAEGSPVTKAELAATALFFGLGSLALYVIFDAIHDRLAQPFVTHLVLALADNAGGPWIFPARNFTEFLLTILAGVSSAVVYMFWVFPKMAFYLRSIGDEAAKDADKLHRTGYFTGAATAIFPLIGVVACLVASDKKPASSN